ncbi:MAG: hypothetical protein PF518_14545 [Spirochaetaceae bacterium]|nr:hypothetical protein [Spirochaetaceae bacterium]
MKKRRAAVFLPRNIIIYLFPAGCFASAAVMVLLTGVTIAMP